MTATEPTKSVPAPESKSSKKKKNKAEPAPQPSPPIAQGEAEGRRASFDEGANGHDGGSESPYVKELQKNIRNVKKKLAGTQKVDAILAENPGATLDELVASKKINDDQRTQAQKKPALQSSLTQMEEQMAQYKQFEGDYQGRLSAEKAALSSAHKEELQKIKDEAVVELEEARQKASKDSLMVLSKFLRAAAAKRQGGDENSPENRAFEGALLLVYGGETPAVEAMYNLISGSEEKVPTVDQTPSDFTYEQVRDLAVEYTPYAAEEAWVEEVAQSEPAPPSGDEPLASGTDPTVAHAGLTEMNAEAELPVQSDLENHIDTPSVPDASNIDAGAANAAGGANWNAKVIPDDDVGPDRVHQTMARDPAETETGNTATPAAATGTQSWAEEVIADAPAPATYPQPTVNGSDGFREVHHNRGGRSRGGQSDFRGGRGRGGGGRGQRGPYRGDRGRGRGGGYRGAHRGRGGEGP